MVAEGAVVAHAAQVVVERAAVARIERIVVHHVLHAVDSVIELMLFVTALVEARREIEDISARLVEAFEVGARGIRIR